jgi:asparagine synthase (glutamine-hydrolysing)
MCGIFGAVSLTGRALRYPDQLRAMAAALAHRGPDGVGTFGHERAKIGACRLAIVDPAGGDQPFRSPDNAAWLVCNGEIYNAPALRHDALARGYPLRSHTDVETVLPLYQRSGASGVSALDGMFGLAVWDDRCGRVVLARDRAGEKPLFWCEAGEELRFASEIQALLVYPDQSRCLNRRAAELYTALGYVPSPHTLIAGIYKLPPAHLLEADAGGVVVRPYWDPAQVARQPVRRVTGAELRRTLLAAVEREAVSDAPLGIFASGGLDSSILVAAAARAVPARQVHTYTIRFPDRGFDESDHALAVSRALGTEHHVVTANEAGLSRALERLTTTLAEPVGDPAVLPVYLLADAARRDCKVVLSGEGADELFGGYPTYVGHQAARWYARVPRVVRRLAARCAARRSASFGSLTIAELVRAFLLAAEEPPLERHLRWFGALGATPAALADFGARLAAFPAIESLNRALWLDFVTYLPEQLLTKVDRGTMLASIEARAPYLDREVLELALPAPAHLKVRGGATKVILREAARGLVPRRVLRRRKHGLSVPVATWLNAGLAPVADRLFARPRIGGPHVARLWAEHRTGRVNHVRTLWPILMAELWAERWGVDVPGSGDDGSN